MEFSWWIWSGLVLLMLAALALYFRAVFVAVRRDGFGNGRIFHGTAAPWAWAGTVLIVVSGLLLWRWVFLLDS